MQALERGTGHSGGHGDRQQQGADSYGNVRVTFSTTRGAPWSAQRHPPALMVGSPAKVLIRNRCGPRLVQRRKPISTVNRLFTCFLQLAQTACLSSIGVAVASCRGHVIPTNCEVADEDLEEACRS
ncbi:hypothetical protein GGR60_003255 [Xanthomonas arboricola]|uniref:hypothetical protein n=1 Tax=Xanthomonas euroxanthea TaxID=2259622 RepID=UPI0014313FEB|nr:hypothetical protein [Xanthomonas euroxanthea]NJC38701.1 hypothetical protein [Xanthomonas euroxanthea]